jgi:hypothetical protein
MVENLEFGDFSARKLGLKKTMKRSTPNELEKFMKSFSFVLILVASATVIGVVCYCFGNLRNSALTDPRMENLEVF